MRDEQTDVEQDLFLGLLTRLRREPAILWDLRKSVQAFKCSRTDAIRKFKEKRSVREIKTLSELPTKQAAGILKSWESNGELEPCSRT